MDLEGILLCSHSAATALYTVTDKFIPYTPILFFTDQFYCYTHIYAYISIINLDTFHLSLCHIYMNCVSVKKLIFLI